MKDDGILESYEQTPYATGAHYETHPDTLATVAALLGVDAPHPRQARVLEIGCATGGNLLPMAVAMPEARFVGIDLSPRQIEIAGRIADLMQLQNVDLRAMDLMKVEPSLGEFDYIICHGVYSWVPDPVRAKILEICREQLSTAGVAYISFNTYPGWHLRGIVRDMMAWHAGHHDAPAERIAAARQLLVTMEKAVGDRETVYGRIISDEARELADEADYYVLHEHLDGVNQPFYFHQFQKQLEEAGLTYLSEAAIASSAWSRHGNKTEAALAEFSSDPLQREQYLDFLSNRIFRRSLVCHRNAGARLGPDTAALRSMFFSAMLRCAEDEAQIAGSGSMRFETADGKNLTTNHPVTKRALWELTRAWPVTIGFEQLRVRCECPEEAMAKLLMECVTSGLVLANRMPPPTASKISDHPAAFEYARRQAEDGVDAVTNLRHRGVVLERIDPAVLALLDGSRDITAVAGELAEAVKQGDIDAGHAADDDRLQQGLMQYVRGALQRFHHGSLLVR